MPGHVLPTFAKLGLAPPVDISASSVAAQWFAAFSTAVAHHDVPALLALMLDDGYWRDHLALTWDFRTFHTAPAIAQFLNDRLALNKVGNLKVSDRPPPELVRPYDDLAWVQVFFTFDTAAGGCTGVARLVAVPPSSSSQSQIPEWKAFSIYTTLESLHNIPEAVGPARSFHPNHGLWLTQRQRELEFRDEEPTVLIVGGGQGGLDCAARLKALGVSALVVERAPRVGNQWRERYQALCLHDPVWYDHLPYLPFPSTWPVYTPAHKLADWLESYAHHLELNIWTSSSLTSASYSPLTKSWTIAVDRALPGTNGAEREERVLRPRHVIYAAGLAGGVPNMPQLPGMDEFKGKIVHSTAHKTAKDYIGKKVLVVGACTSAHDISQDFAVHGVDITMYQRASTYIMSTKNGMPVLMKGLYWEDGPPTDVADRISASLPNEVMKLMHARHTARIADMDRATLEGLEKVGFKLNYGVEGSGFLNLAYTRGGGYYLDVGASKLIIDGKIKLKNDAVLEKFTPDGVAFSDGSEIDVDLVVFATGFGDVKVNVRKIFGDEMTDKLHPTWNYDEESEIRGVWRDSGHENFWFMMGNLCLCRFHSKHIALQIKAMEEGVFGTRYTRS